ncbi:hypothetical protein F383_14677 [Gossypium arboreum]|uniref:Uncharacterized protein n=1 Tax=Gossypium arboreum TaxID=29729 RepID=A0A0B0NAS6_GOSAR|nr:hypothetical protein F383_14677 [Gossypium arboreum]
MEYGENLVGLKVHYNDGDEEILNLKREKWAVIEDESRSSLRFAGSHSVHTVFSWAALEAVPVSASSFY